MGNSKVLLSVLVLCCLVSAAAWLFRATPVSSPSSFESGEQRRFAQVQIQVGAQGPKTELVTVVADNPKDIQQGLSDRESIDADGMLFLLPTKSTTSFWMYHMRFPLDFIWISDGVVVDLHENVPAVPFTTPERDIPLVTPIVPAEAVIEVPAGLIHAQGIERGMSVALQVLPGTRNW